VHSSIQAMIINHRQGLYTGRNCIVVGSMHNQRVARDQSWGLPQKRDSNTDTGPKPGLRWTPDSTVLVTQHESHAQQSYSLKAHSHQARLRVLTDIDARLHWYGTHAKRPARSYQAHLCPSTVWTCSKSNRAWFWVHLRQLTDVDGRRCASTSIDAALIRWKAWPNQAHLRARHMSRDRC